MNPEPILIERTYHAPVSEVWKAITDREQMKQWYFDLPAFKPEVGFSFQFEAGKDAKKYLHKCVIKEVIPEKKLAYSWEYPGYGGSSLVTFNLFAEGQSTRIRLSHEGVETFPIDNPDLGKENFRDGWNYIIGTSLPEFLAKAK